MMRRLRWVAMVAAMATAGCGILGPDELESSFEDNLALWASQNATSYEFETRTQCFCIPSVTFWHRVTVRNLEVVAVEPLEGTDPVPVEHYTSWRTIDQVFSSIRSVLEDTEIDWTVEASYHDQLGYPVMVDIAADEQIADAGSVTEIRNVVVN